MENTRVKKGKNKHFRWSKLMEKSLLEVLADEAQKGNRPSSTFRPASYARVAQAISKKFGVTCTPEHVMNHLRTTQKAWNTIQTLRSKSEFVWDEELKMVTADPEVYEEEVMANPSHEKFLNKTIEMYEEMGLVVGKDTVNGSFAKQLGDDLSLDAEVDSTPIELDDDIEDSKHAKKEKAKDTSCTSTQKRPYRKRKSRDGEDPYLKISEQLSEMAKAMKALSQDHEQARISKLYEVVMRIKGYDEVALANAFDYMVQNANIGRAFMVKSDKLRRIWLDNFIKHGGDGSF